MIIESITRSEAIEKTGMCLPAGLRWYWVSGLQFYPRYGDWSHTWACEDGLSAIIGKRKCHQAVQAELERVEAADREGEYPF